MFYESELLFLRKALTKCNLKNLIINAESTIDCWVDKEFLDLFGVQKVNKRFADVFPEMRPKTIYRVTDMFLFRYIFFELPFNENEDILIIGPYINIDITRQQILEQGEKMNISAKNIKELEFYYASIPVIKDDSHIFALINTFAEFLWGGSDGYECVDISRENSASYILNGMVPTISEDKQNLNINAMEKRYNYENELITAVSQGNAQKAEFMMAGFSSLAFENRVSDNLRNMKNYCIIMNTILRKAAEKGGVHPVFIDKVSSDYAKRIELVNSVSQMPDFMLEILRTYCRLVRRHSVKDYSPLVQKVIIKVENDLTCDLSLNEMAKICNVSPNYLSNLFKSQTGKTLTQYVNGKRVNYAKHLLKTTNLQIQTIAQHCGILDFHYFCRIFKSITGKTPSEYRSGITFD